MTKNLKLLWSNSQKTPLSAENLSKYIEPKADKRILFLDNVTRTPHTDNILKLKSGSAIPISEKVTWAFFGFNNSFVSHDGDFSPITVSNASFTPEMMNDNLSLALETGTTNLIADTDFGSIDNSSEWSKIVNGSSQMLIDSSKFYGSSVLKFSTDTSGNRVELGKTISTSLQNMVYGNLSFYYNTTDNGNLKVVIQGMKDGVLHYWRNDTETWSDIEFVVDLPGSSNEWIRFEAPRINFLSLNSNIITFKIYSTDGNKTSYVSKPQYEIGTNEKDFCSSFVSGTRSNSVLEYSPTLIDLRQGTIDFNMLMKTQRSFTVFSMKDSSGNNVFSFEYISDSFLGIYKFVFSVKDYTTQTNITLEKNINPLVYVGKWRRILLTWNKDAGLLIKSQLSIPSDTTNDFQVTKAVSYVPTPRQNLQKFIFGNNAQTLAGFMNGVLNSFKINVDDKAVEDIASDFIGQVAVDPVEYRLYESGIEDMMIENNYLFPSYNLTDFEPNMSYILVFNDTDDGYARLFILRSLDDLLNSGIKTSKVKIIGGFNTDADSKPIYSTVWDVYQNKIPTTEVERLFVKGTNSTEAKVEIRTSPESDDDRVVVKIPSYYNNFIYGRTTVASSPFMTIDPAGAMYFDDLSINGFNTTLIDGQTITSSNISTMNGSSLVLTSNSLVNGEYITGHSNIVLNTGNINANSGTAGIISLDAVRIKNNNIYSDPLSDLVINSDKASKNIVIDSTNGNINMHSNFMTISTDHKSVDIDNVNIRDNLITNLAGDMHVQAAATLDLNSGTGTITLDNISIKNNLISDIDMVISGSSSITMQSNTTNMVMDNNDITLSGKNNINIYALQKILLSAPEIDFVASNTGKIISLDSIKIDENTLYTSALDFNIKTVTSGNLNLTAAGNIVTQSTQLNASAASMIFSTSSSSIVLDGLKLVGTALYSNLTVSMSIGNNNSNININAIGNSVSVNATTTNISGNIQMTSGASLIFNATDATRSRLRYLADVPSWAAPINTSSGNSGLVVDGDFAAEQIWNATYNDLAECWLKDEYADVKYGQVIVQTEHGARPSIKRAERATVGVSSYSFGYILGSKDFNKDLSKSKKIPIAISGRAKVQYVGSVRLGDEMVSFKYGNAIKANIFEKIFMRERLIGRVDSVVDNLFCWIKVY